MGELLAMTDANRNRIMDFIDRQTTFGGTNFRPAFELASRVLIRSLAESKTAGCGRIVMLLTDGEESSTEPFTIEDAHALDLNVPVFTYTFGSFAPNKETLI